MRPQFSKVLKMSESGRVVLATGPIDLAPGDVEVVTWARVVQGSVAAWSYGSMDRDAIRAELDGAKARLTPAAVQSKANRIAVELQKRPSEATNGSAVEVAVLDPPPTGLAEFTARIDLGPQWLSIRCEARANEAFTPGKAEVEGWHWINRIDDEGDTYKFSIYWTDSVMLETDPSIPDPRPASAA
jgi:hypothetical protein